MGYFSGIVPWQNCITYICWVLFRHYKFPDSIVLFIFVEYSNCSGIVPWQYCIIYIYLIIFRHIIPWQYCIAYIFGYFSGCCRGNHRQGHWKIILAGKTGLNIYFSNYFPTYHLSAITIFEFRKPLITCTVPIYQYEWWDICLKSLSFQRINPFPHSDTFWHISSRRLLKT